MLQIQLDRERCHGHARCWAICPEVFDIDDDTQQAILLRTSADGDLESLVREAVSECPEQAISISAAG